MGRGRGRKTIELRERAREILATFQPATVRSVAYKLFSEGFIPNMSKRETTRVSRILTCAREDDEIPWDWIVDNTRKPTWPGTYSSPMSFSRSVAAWWRQDPWEYQDARVEVWSEKDTVSGVLAPVLNEYAVPFRVNRGFTSATAAHDIAEETTVAEKPLVALYFGDFDPSGLYMSVADLPQRLEKYDADIDNLDLRRIALTRADCAAMPDLSFPASEKSRDPRYRWFLQHSGQTRCWELDAMDPNTLRARVEDAIRQEIDFEAWDRVLRTDRVVQESLDAYMAKWAKTKGISELVQKYEGEA
jgi:hypothetical protein